MSKIERDGFWLFVLLIAVTFFVGLSTDWAAFVSGFVKLGYMFTGRLPSGQPMNYPGNGSLPAGVIG